MIPTKVIELYGLGLPVKEIASLTGLTTGNIQYIRKQAGIPTRSHKGPFYKTCEICNEKKLVKNYRDSLSKRCRLHIE